MKRKCVNQTCDCEFGHNDMLCPKCMTEWTPYYAAKKRLKTYKRAPPSDTESDSECETMRSSQIEGSLQWLEEEKLKLKNKERELLEKSELEYKMYREEADKCIELRKKLEEELKTIDQRLIEKDKETLNKISEKDKEITNASRIINEQKRHIQYLQQTLDSTKKQYMEKVRVLDSIINLINLDVNTSNKLAPPAPTTSGWKWNLNMSAVVPKPIVINNDSKS